MKFVKNSILTSLLLLSQQSVLPNPQQHPFSPCSTDMPVVVTVENNLEDVLDLIFPSHIQTDIPTHSTTLRIKDQPLTAMHDKQYTNNCITKLSEIIHKVKVNGIPLKKGEATTINVQSDTPLLISITDDSCALLQYAIENNFIHQLPYMVQLCAKAYNKTHSFFNSTPIFEILIEVDKLKNEILEDLDNPVINFYDILDLVANRVNEPEHIKWRLDGYKNPVIQIV